MTLYSQQSDLSSKGGMYISHVVITSLTVFFSTIITIAHRLNTVLDYDRILVLKEGSIAELDTPRNLMQQDNGIFRGMCQVVRRKLTSWDCAGAQPD